MLLRYNKIIQKQVEDTRSKYGPLEDAIEDSHPFTDFIANFDTLLTVQIAYK